MIIAATHGPDDDWHDIVEQHEPALRRFIGKRMANRHLVDDALQETYLRAIRSPNRPDGRWLRALARRASVDVYRAEPPPGPEVDPLSSVAEWAAADNNELPGSDEHVAAIASRQAVRWAFARLSPRHQRLLLLRGVHELTYDEIAEREGVSAEALTSALNRARERLRAGMAAYERGGVAAVLGVGNRLRLRMGRAQASLGSLPVAELAGTTLVAGLVAVASLAPTGQRARVATATTGPSADAEAVVPVADLRPGAAAAAGDDIARGPVPANEAPTSRPHGQPKQGRPVDATTDVVVTPDNATVAVVVDSATVTGARTARVSVTYSCSKSGLLGPTCRRYDRATPKGW